jgi:hypothetical protein
MGSGISTASLSFVCRLAEFPSTASCRLLIANRTGLRPPMRGRRSDEHDGKRGLRSYGHVLVSRAFTINPE